ncbi:DUF6318 family protein [Intrasporangium sp.]|uniref:DUF6318 family protein n=1 Tax=Intrasporangium sp. TaxID=1925024 RepID=UPI003221EC82
MTVRRRAMSYAAGLGAVVVLSSVLAGCGSGSPEPAATGAVPTVSTSSGVVTGRGPVSSTPSVSATSAPTIEGLPQAARARTREGANAFVKYYFEQVNEASVDPRRDALAGFGLPTCKTCVAFEDTINGLAAKSHRYRSAPLSERAVDGLGQDRPTDPRYTVLAAMAQVGAQVIDDSGKEVKRDTRYQGSFIVDLVWREGRWVLSEIRVSQP